MLTELSSTDPGVIEIDGLLIPDAGGVFLAALAVHVLAGAVCVVAGAVAASARKRPRRHPRAGTVYLCGLLVLVITAGVLAVVRWPDDVQLLLIACATATFGGAGWWLGRHRTDGWMRWHGLATSAAKPAVPAVTGRTREALPAPATATNAAGMMISSNTGMSGSAENMPRIRSGRVAVMARG